MASDDQWPPVASVGKGAAKINGNKRNVKDSQQKILSVVNEMFGSALEPEIILTVVQNCKWELQPSIEGLITLTETVDNPSIWDDVEKIENMSSTGPISAPQFSGLLGGSKEVIKNELPAQEPPSDSQLIDPRLQSKWEKPKKGGSKNRMDSFCGNIAKLKSSTETNASANIDAASTKEQKPKNPLPMDEDFLFTDILNYGASGVEKLSSMPPKLGNFGEFPGIPLGTESAGLFPPAGDRESWSRLTNRVSLSHFAQSSSPPPKNESKRNEKFLEAKAAAENAEFNKDPKRDCKPTARKDETESLCGLKVQYRISGMESSSDDDDDADVVIEDEASDYKINLTPSMSINVSQFLSPPTQTAPKRTLPEFHMISTPSPPRTPMRSAIDLALNPIKTIVQNGYKIMILLRGLPGSGKSTLAKKIVDATVGGKAADFVFNTDDFFVTLGRGVYKFDPSKLQDAHNANHRRVWNAVKEGRSPVIVDNTHIEAWEMRPYAAMAVENGYIVEVLEPHTPWAENINQLAKKNTHNVPKAKIRDRAKRYERNINGKSLLERFSLKYSPQNKPPQMRIIPPVEEKVSAISASIANIESNWTNHEKNKYVLTSHDIESMRNIDENHSGINAISEAISASATDSSESSSNAEKGVNFREELFNDYLQELQDSDDESFEMLEGSGSENLSDIIRKSGDNKETYGSHRSLASVKLSPDENAEESAGEAKDTSPISSQQILGAIGSERKGSLSVGSSLGNLDNEKLETKNLSPNGSQQVLGAIGSERKGSFSIGANVQNIACEKSENNDSNGTQQALGAIGSERKGSFSVASNSANLETELRKIDAERQDNVLAQCWDFTLLLGRYKIHSTHLNPDFPRKTKTKEERASKEKKKDAYEKNDKNEGNLRNDENVFRKDVCEIVELQDCADDIVNDEGFSVDEKKEKEVENLGLEDEEPKNDETVTVEETTNTPEEEEEVIGTKNDSLKLCEALQPEKREEIEKTDSLVEKIENSDSLVEKIEYSDSLVETIENSDSLVEKIEYSDSLVETIENSDSLVEKIENSDSLVEKIENSNSLVEKIEEATEVMEEVTKEVSETTPKASTAFGTFLNMLKTSLLGGAEETSSNDFKDENPDISSSPIYETAPPSPSYSEPKDFSTDSVDSPGVPEKSVEPKEPKVAEDLTSEIADKSADKNDHSRAEISTNPFRVEIAKSLEKNPSHDDQQLITDNINSISWKESPFPIDGAKIPVLPIPEDNKEVLKEDASTNTTYYDFNVAYVGGTSEPGYRELNAVSRCINQGPSVAKLERPPLKLMLDKSSMTNEVDILATEQNLNIEKDKDAGNRIQELVELFPNIPIDSLTAFYNQECKGNFDWAVEVLLEDVPTDFTIKALENRRSNLESEDSSLGADSPKKSNIELGKFKQRSHSSSPRHRRQRIKDFRSFSMEYAENRSCSSRDHSLEEKDDSPVNDHEEIILDSFYEKAALATNVPLDIAENPEASSSSTASGLTETEDEVDEVLELDFGREFVNKLEKTFGNDDFTFPDEFKPVIRIKKSMAEQLHALWIESMYDQMNERHAKLDMMIAKDEEMARALDREETMQPTSEIAAPNLEEIMDMELALACYKNELKEKIARETPNDMASRLSRQMLYESLPDIDPQTLSEILKAHDGNFKETCETIENSTGRTISKSDTLKKQQNLLDRVKEESKYRGIRENVEDFVAPLVVVNPDIHAAAKAEKFSYKAAVARGENARKEAQKQFALRMENFNKAAEAYRKGNPGVAAYYSQMAKLHSENIETAHAEAADAFVSAQIYHTDNEDTLDLHNFFVSEALQALDRFLELQLEKLGKSNKRSSTLYIITGRGARSNNGLSKIKPAVSKKLISRNIRFTEANPGCLKVTLSRKNCILE